MTKSLIVILALAAASTGCAGLNVSWSATASYNTNARTMTDTQHMTSPGNDEKK